MIKQNQKNANHAKILLQLMICSMGLCMLPTIATAQDEKQKMPSPTKPQKRDPFWPIGYTPENVTSEAKNVPEKNKKKTETVERSIAKQELKISGFATKDGTPRVCILGSWAEEGNRIDLKVNGSIFAWKIISIHSGKNLTQPNDTESLEYIAGKLTGETVVVGLKIISGK